MARSFLIAGSMKKLFKIYILVLLAFLSCACLTGGHLKDEKLIENFQSHKAEFNQLLQMFLADKKFGRVASDFTRPASVAGKCESPNSRTETEAGEEQKLAEYRRLFSVLGLSAGIEGYCEKATVFFYASTQGLSVSGSTKGYAYLSKAPEKSVDNLDNYRSADNQSFTAFRHIEGNWYLYFDYED